MEIRFREGISEVIATTHNRRPNAAPMGIINRGSFHIAVYKDSHTFLNIKKNHQLVANLVEDPVLYVRTAFEDLEPESFYFNKEALILKDAYAWVAFECSVHERPTQKSAIVELAPVRAAVLQRPVMPANRAFCAVLEATILATRYEFLRDSDCLRRIDEYEHVVRRCGGTREFEAFEMLKTYLQEASSSKA
ncbi:MAG TPA: DUF447 domain-containing protein [Candidatus Bathyarchaeia archaeon]|nr:DUF447 domain-containing protein [Candidatus Bathyarchaeia archaeon]